MVSETAANECLGLSVLSQHGDLAFDAKWLPDVNGDLDLYEQLDWPPHLQKLAILGGQHRRLAYQPYNTEMDQPKAPEQLRWLAHVYSWKQLQLTLRINITGNCTITRRPASSAEIVRDMIAVAGELAQKDSPRLTNLLGARPRNIFWQPSF